MAKYDSTIPQTSGVYWIVCLPTGDSYVGASKNMRSRWDYHVNHLLKGKHKSFKLQECWNTYGQIGFEVRVLESVDEDLFQAEQWWIRAVKPTCNGTKVIGPRKQPEARKCFICGDWANCEHREFPIYNQS